MSHTANQRYDVPVGSVRNVAVSFAGLLDSGELLTGTPTITEVSTSDLTITNKVISTAILTINDISVPIAEAVQFSFSGQLVDVKYTIKISIGTDATPAQTLIGQVRFDGE